MKGVQRFLWISTYVLAGLLNGCGAEAAFALRLPHWGKLRDGYRLHRVFYGAWGDVIGDYYQVRPGEGFTAQCERGTPAEFAMESLAAEYVEQGCPWVGATVELHRR